MGERARREVLDYSRADRSVGSGSSSGPTPAPGSGGSFMKAYIRLRPSDIGSEGELPYSLPEVNKISIKENREPFPTEHQFAFHRIYDRGTSQDEVYRDVAAQSVSHVFHGYNACIFAYGQTGSGKTYTMYGPSGGADAKASPQLRGIVPRCAEAIFTEAESRTPYSDASVAVSLCEIYCDKVRDLGKAYAARGDKSERAQQRLLRLKTSDLHTQARTQSHGFAAGDPGNISSLYALENLDMHEDAKGQVYVKGLSIIPVQTVDEVLEVVTASFALRATHETKMNSVSSRSHTIFTFHVTQKDRGTGQSTTAILHLVDLAGSERLSKSDSTGQRKLEAQSINLSLTCLSKVVVSLQTTENADGPASAHIPYRDSKLTRLLQGSLGGNCYTSLIATVHPRLQDLVETLSTLQFANRCQTVLNRPRVNYLFPGAEDVAKRLRQLEAEMAVARHNTIRLRLAAAARSMRLMAEAGVNGSLTANGQFRTETGLVIGMTQDESESHPYVVRALSLLSPDPSEEDLELYHAGQATRAQLLAAVMAAQTGSASARARGSVMPQGAPMTDFAIERAIEIAVSGMATSAGIIGAGVVLPPQPAAPPRQHQVQQQLQQQLAQGQGDAGSSAGTAAGPGSSGSVSFSSATQGGPSSSSQAPAPAGLTDVQLQSSSSFFSSGGGSVIGGLGPLPAASGQGASAAPLSPTRPRPQPSAQLLGALRPVTSGSGGGGGGGGAALPGSPKRVGDGDGSRSLYAPAFRPGGAGAGSSYGAYEGGEAGTGGGDHLSMGSMGSVGSEPLYGGRSSSSLPGQGQGQGQGGHGQGLQRTGSSFALAPGLGPGQGAGQGTMQMSMFAPPGSSSGGGGSGGGGAGPGVGGGVGLVGGSALTSRLSLGLGLGGAGADPGSPRGGLGAGGRLQQSLGLGGAAASEAHAAEVAKLKGRVAELKREAEETRAKAAAEQKWLLAQTKAAQDKSERAQAEAAEAIRAARDAAAKARDEHTRQVQTLLDNSNRIVTEQERLAAATPRHAIPHLLRLAGIDLHLGPGPGAGAAREAHEGKEGDGRGSAPSFALSSPRGGTGGSGGASARSAGASSSASSASATASASARPVTAVSRPGVGDAAAPGGDFEALRRGYAEAVARLRTSHDEELAQLRRKAAAELAARDAAQAEAAALYKAKVASRKKESADLRAQIDELRAHIASLERQVDRAGAERTAFSLGVDVASHAVPPTPGGASASSGAGASVRAFAPGALNIPGLNLSLVGGGGAGPGPLSSILGAPTASGSAAGGPLSVGLTSGGMLSAGTRAAMSPLPFFPAVGTLPTPGGAGVAGSASAGLASPMRAPQAQVQAHGQAQHQHQALQRAGSSAGDGQDLGYFAVHPSEQAPRPQTSRGPDHAALAGAYPFPAAASALSSARLGVPVAVSVASTENVKRAAARAAITAAVELPQSPVAAAGALPRSALLQAQAQAQAAQQPQFQAQQALAHAQHSRFTASRAN